MMLPISTTDPCGSWVGASGLVLVERVVCLFRDVQLVTRELVQLAHALDTSHHQLGVEGRALLAG
jgi:hypothetical protein